MTAQELEGVIRIRDWANDVIKQNQPKNTQQADAVTAFYGDSVKSNVSAQFDAVHTRITRLILEQMRIDNSISALEEREVAESEAVFARIRPLEAAVYEGIKPPLVANATGFKPKGAEVPPMSGVWTMPVTPND